MVRGAATVPPAVAMLRWAASVRLALPPAVFVMLAEMVMLPWAGPDPAVVTQTSTPLSNAASMDALLTMAVAAVEFHTLLVLVAVLPAVLMVMSVGSINHCPFLPAL